MVGGRGGVGALADEAIDALKHPPTQGKGGVEVHGLEQGGDGPLRILLGDPAKPALLMQKAPARLQGLQAVEDIQRLLDPAKAALSRCGDQEQIAVVRIGLKEPKSAEESLIMSPLRLAPAQLGHPPLNLRTRLIVGHILGYASVRGGEEGVSPLHYQIGQKFAVTFIMTTRGTSGMVALMNSAEVMKVFFSLLSRLVA